MSGPGVAFRLTGRSARPPKAQTFEGRAVPGWPIGSPLGGSIPLWRTSSPRRGAFLKGERCFTHLCALVQSKLEGAGGHGAAS